MPINNITQTISILPPAGKRGVDVQTVFVIKQEDFQDHLQGTTVDELNTFKDQLNSRIGEINSTTTTMNGYANTASAGASTATTKAGEASTSAGEALAYKNQAETFKNNASTSATKASQWADNTYNVEVETGRYSAKHWSIVAQNTVSNKIDKVVSTDNAIVRFNGTTGDVQNSGVIIDDSGNIGIGVTPSASTRTTLQSQYNMSTGNDESNLSTNAYYSGGVFKYIANGYATSYLQQKAGGSHTWKTAPSGTAGSNITWTNAMTLDASGNLLLTSGTGVLGYGAGAGGTVTQLTSKSTAVTLNKPSGRIIMHNESLAAGATVNFGIYNSLVTTTDIVNLSSFYSTVDPRLYRIEVGYVSHESFNIKITNTTAGSLSHALLVSFSIIKGATA